MSTTKQHLTEFHEAAASHHLAMAKSHKKLAALFGKTESDHDKTLCEEHKAMSASHTTMGEFHTKCAKAIGVEDLSKADQLVPDKVSAVITGFPKAVPRAGQRPLDKAAENVPIEFRSLVTVEED